MIVPGPSRFRPAILRMLSARPGPVPGAERYPVAVVAPFPAPTGPSSTPPAQPAPCSGLCPCTIEFPGETA
jgi:hypothetical protein